MIYDVGETHGVTFMAMELIHGEKAYRLYAEGINLHERYREAEAATQFEKAIALDPTFAMAYAKLAVVHNNLGRQDLRDQYAELALKHGDRLTPRERYYIEGFHYSNRHATHRAEHGCLPQVH